MLKVLGGKLHRFVVRPVLWWAGSVEQDDPHQQTAWQRGKAEAIAAAKDGRSFGLAATVTTVLAPTVVGVLTTHLPAPAQVALIVLAGIVGYLAVPTVWAIAGAARALPRQRDHARRERLTALRERDEAQAEVERLKAPPPITGIDELRLLLAKGRTFLSLFSGGTMNVAAAMNESTMSALKDWYDDIYRTLLAEGLRAQAERWLGTPPLSAAEVNFLNVAVAQASIRTQVKCFEGIVKDLDRELQARNPEPTTLATEFSDWVRTKQAALPRGGWRQQVGAFPWGGESQDTHAQRRLESERRQDQIERIHAQARTEYHEQFRARVAAVLGETKEVQEPQTIADLEKLSVQVARAAGVSPSPKTALRTLSRDGFSLRNQIPAQPTVEQRKALEPQVDSFRERAAEELADCAPEFVSELEAVPAYDPADLDGIPLKGERVSLSDYMQQLLAVIGNAIKAA